MLESRKYSVYKKIRIIKKTIKRSDGIVTPTTQPSAKTSGCKLIRHTKPLSIRD
jgi:hypothetical protein